jgi:hypothetical protein
MTRIATLQRAVLRRISRAGDMPIRIRTRSLVQIVRASGFPHWGIPNDDGYREVDAFALEALCRLGGGMAFA